MAAVERIQAALTTPQRLTWERRHALEQTEASHYILALQALGQAIPGLSSGLSQRVIEEAMRTIRECQWARRQCSWARQGMPRPGPAGRAEQLQY
jgi:hypothetical protein